MSRRAERDPWGSSWGKCFQFTPVPSLWTVGGPPGALLSGITELARGFVYSKEIPCLPFRLGKNMMLLEARGLSFRRQGQFPAASVVTV